MFGLVACILFFRLIRVIWHLRTESSVKLSTFLYSLPLHYSAIDLTSLLFWVFLTGRRFPGWGWVWPRKAVLQNWQDANLKEVAMVIAFPCFANYDFATKAINLIIVDFWQFRYYPANIYLFEVSNRNTRKRCEIYSELTIKTPEQGQ